MKNYAYLVLCILFIYSCSYPLEIRKQTINEDKNTTTFISQLKNNIFYFESPDKIPQQLNDLSVNSKNEILITTYSFIYTFKNFVSITAQLKNSEQSGYSYFSIDDDGDGIFVSQPNESSDLSIKRNLYIWKVEKNKISNKIGTLENYRSGFTYKPKISNSNKGMGIFPVLDSISRKLYLIKIDKFLLTEKIEVDSELYPDIITADINDDGNGLIVYLKNKTLIIKKITNFLPEKDYSSLNGLYGKLNIKIDNSGNGLLSYIYKENEIENGLFSSDINLAPNLIISKIENFKITEIKTEINAKTIMFYNFDFDRRGNGFLVWDEQDKQLQNSIFYTKLKDYRLNGEKIKIDINNYGLKSHPLVKINNMGNGIILWSESLTWINGNYCGKLIFNNVIK